MKKYRLQANISHWLADMARRAAHIESRSLSSYVANLIVKDLQSKGIMDAHGRRSKLPPGGEYRVSDDRPVKDSLKSPPH